VTWHGSVLKDTTPTVFNILEVLPEVRPDPSPSRNDIQLMINSVLERQAKSTDKFLCRLIEEWDGKKHDATSVNSSSPSSFSSCAISFTQTNSHTSGLSAGDTSIPNPLA
jgi:hypothetical protein